MPKGVSHPPWLRPPKIPPTLIFGPPCSGKTTYVKKNKRLGDIVIDLDTIVKSITNIDRHKYTTEVLDLALYERNKLLSSLNKKSLKAWIILTEAKPAWREWWKKKLNTSDVVVLEPSLEECLARADTEEIKQVIRDWYAIQK